ncbi:N-acetylmuramoyl-L-alanine amidase [Brevibacillus laterosporus]|nr:SH3 domain-containing protein [Brevibacillus laterosporus]RAP27090.1 N-acetylmuramoyl-L-alanine amidase [Brevibacillus laterosporus]
MFSRKKMIIGLATCLTSLVAPLQMAWAANQVQVTADILNIRSGPGTNYQLVSSVPKSTKLTVLSKKDKWIQVKLPNGKQGWGLNTYLQEIKAPPQPPKVIYLKSTVDMLNVRTEPKPDAQIVQIMDKTKSYKMIKKEGVWAQIQLSDKTTGWVNANFVQHATPPTTSAPLPGAPSPTNPTADQNNQPTPADVLPPVEPTVQPPSNSSIKISAVTNVYAEPNVAAVIIGQLSAGDQVSKYSESNGWDQILYNGTTAWISKPGALPSDQTTMPPTQPNPASSSTTVKVTGNNVNIRSQANTTSQVITQVNNGNVLPVLSQSNDWFQVKTPDGKTGWIASWLVTKSTVTPPTLGVVDPNEHKNQNNLQPSVPSNNTEMKIKVLNEGTNVRSGPGTEYEPVGTVQPGESYSVIKTEGEWYQIRLKDNTTAYIASWVVQKESTDLNNLPALSGNEARGKLIVIDPGHGGTDSGAVGTSYKTFEKEINLQVALKLKQRLEASGARVIMTRADDTTLTLEQRVQVAVQNNADMFVSVHHNTHPNAATNGTIMFYYHKGKSMELAELTQREIVATTQYKDLTSRFGDFHVIRENPKPAILAEIGFMTNPQEEANLRDEQHQHNAAEGLFRGILRYFQVYPN